MSSAGLAQLDAVAVLRHPRRVERSKSYIFTAVIGLPGGEDVVLLLRYFNVHNDDFTDGAFYQIKANISLPIPGVDLHYEDTAVLTEDQLSIEEHDLMGDIIWLTPQSTDQVQPRYGALLYVSGATGNIDKARSSFEVHVEQYISFLRDLQNSSGSKDRKKCGAPCTIRATLPDSPRWKDSKPMPSSGKYVSAYGVLAGVDRETVKINPEQEADVAKALRMNIEGITFLGTAPPPPRLADPASQPEDATKSARKRLRAVPSTSSLEGEGSPGKRKATQAASGEPSATRQRRN